MKLHLLISTVVTFLATQTFASSESVSWSASPFDQKVFIENKGQFDGKASSKIFFGTSVDGVELYFSATGITYRHDEVASMSEEERETIESEERKMIKSKPYYLSMEWVGANPQTTIITQDSVSFYYTYGEERGTLTAHAYKKIIYKNLYPGIDVEYFFPEGNEGIKYSVIVHPGADASRITMKYAGAESLSLDNVGNVVIKSSFGEFVDHAPVTTAEKSIVPSSFLIKGDEVSFTISTYDRAHELIIDPWVTNPNFPTHNTACDVNYDLAGNVYIYGSYAPFKLAKFNDAGALQWIFNATSLRWVPFGNVNYYFYGDFAVDEISGTSYLVEGYQDYGARILKVNTLGLQAGMFPGDSNMNEMGRAEYNHCLNKIVIAGGGTSSHYQAAMLDTNLVNITPVNVLSVSDSTCCYDMALLAIDNNSDFCYMATLRPTHDTSFINVLIKCPVPNLLPLAFSVPSGHKFGEARSMRYTSMFGYPATACNGMNGMAVGPSRLYTYDSDSLKVWDKNTGALIAGLHVSPRDPVIRYKTLIQVSWAGIAADECDNVYVGVLDTIKEYNSSLSLIKTFTLPGTVYDVKYGPNNKLYACGKGFVSQIDVVPNKTSLTLTQTPAGCNVCDGTATVSAVSCGSNPSGFSYAWNTTPIQTTQTATGLCLGTYTVKVTSNCNISFTDSVTITDGGLKPVITAARKRPGDEVTIPILLEPSTQFTTAKEIDVTVTYDPALLRFVNVTSSVGVADSVTHSNGEISFRIRPTALLSTPSSTIAELHMQGLLAPYAEEKIDVTSSLITLESGEKIAVANCPATFSLDSNCIMPHDLRTRSSATIEGIYPNPTQGNTKIILSILGSPNVQLEIYDVFGRKVQSLHDGILTSGSCELEFETKTFSNGIYFIQLFRSSETITKAFNVKR